MAAPDVKGAQSRDLEGELTDEDMDSMEGDYENVPSLFPQECLARLHQNLENYAGWTIQFPDFVNCVEATTRVLGEPIRCVRA